MPQILIWMTIPIARSFCGELSLHDEFEASAFDTGKGATAPSNFTDLVLMDVGLPDNRRPRRCFARCARWLQGADSSC